MMWQCGFWLLSSCLVALTSGYCLRPASETATTTRHMWQVQVPTAPQANSSSGLTLTDSGSCERTTSVRVEQLNVTQDAPTAGLTPATEPAWLTKQMLTEQRRERRALAIADYMYQCATQRQSGKASETFEKERPFTYPRFGEDGQNDCGLDD